jgi:hypothetical protein
MEDNKKTNIIDTSILIGFLTLLGYMIAFMFQLSQADYYGIPYFFIKITIENIIFSTFIVAAIIISFSTYFDFFKKNREIRNMYISRIRLMFGIYLITASFIQFIGLIQLIAYWFTCIIYLIISEFIFPLYLGRKTKGWKNKVDAVDTFIRFYVKNKVVDGKKSLIENIFLKTNVLPYEFLIIFMLCLYCAFVSGFYYVRFKAHYYVLNTNPDSVLVTKYGDVLFTVNLDKDTLIFKPELNMIDKDYILENKIKMEYKKIGNLIQPEILIKNY